MWMACCVSGFAGSLMSQIWPSLMHDAAALWIARKTVMSWQATAPSNGGAEICGCAITSALSGASSGTETIEILLNGCWHGPPMFCEAIGDDETKIRSRLGARPGESVGGCEPQ